MCMHLPPRKCLQAHAMSLRTPQRSPVDMKPTSHWRHRRTSRSDWLLAGYPGDILSRSPVIESQIFVLSTLPAPSPHLPRQYANPSILAAADISANPLSRLTQLHEAAVSAREGCLRKQASQAQMLNHSSSHLSLASYLRLKTED
jgi:hypothetical protein